MGNEFTHYYLTSVYPHVICFFPIDLLHVFFSGFSNHWISAHYTTEILLQRHDPSDALQLVSYSQFLPNVKHEHYFSITLPKNQHVFTRTVNINPKFSVLSAYHIIWLLYLKSKGWNLGQDLVPLFLLHDIPF